MTPAEVLAVLGDRLNGLAESAAQGKFAYWAGSGVSRNRVPDVPSLVVRILEHLRSRAVAAGGERFKLALEGVLALAVLSPDDEAKVDFNVPAVNWPVIDLIVEQLKRQYSMMLDVPVNGEGSDYLLWTAADVCGTYGSPTIRPDVDHYAIAILILEGVASIVVTSNWDGLIERAVSELTDRPVEDTLGVVVRAEDLREPPARAFLFKFHGCAVLASSDEVAFRNLLVGRESQISGWVANRQQNGLMSARLIQIATTMKTLMLGLSGQDSNIKHVFAAAAADMKWPWPAEPSACMLATPNVEVNHRTILKNVYNSEYDRGQGPAIEAASLIGAYSSSTLLALVIYIICAKLRALLDDALAQDYTEDQRAALCGGLLSLANRLSIALGNGNLDEMNAALEIHSHFMALFLDGEAQAAVHIRYRPLGMIPVQQIRNDQFAESAKLRGLAAGLALLGLGEERRLWALERPDPNDPHSAAIIARSAAGSACRVFMVSTSDAGLKLLLRGRVSDNDDDAIIIYADTLPPSVVRSSSSTYGRTGATSPRRVSIAEIVAGEPSTDLLLQRFRKSSVL